MKVFYHLLVWGIFGSLQATMWTGFGQMSTGVVDVTKGTIVGSGQLVGGQYTTVDPDMMTPYERDWGWNERKKIFSRSRGNGSNYICC